VARMSNIVLPFFKPQGI